MTRASPAATRTADVLRFFAEHPRQSFTLTDIIKSLRMSRATCHALLASLTQAGFLYRSASKSYVMGPALVAVGRVAREYFSPLEIARSEMRELADEFDVICTALFSERGNLVLKERASSLSHLGWLPSIGQRSRIVPPWGSVFMAWSSVEEREKWIGDVTLDGPHPSREQLVHVLEVTRARGFACGLRKFSVGDKVLEQDLMSRAQVTDYLTTEVDTRVKHSLAYVAAPVFDEGGAVAFAIALNGFREPRTWGEIQKVGVRLIESCDRVTQFMGGRILRAGKSKSQSRATLAKPDAGPRPAQRRAKRRSETKSRA